MRLMRFHLRMSVRLKKPDSNIQKRDDKICNYNNYRKVTVQNFTADC